MAICVTFTGNQFIKTDAASASEIIGRVLTITPSYGN